jgi:uncharacterized membrane protein
MVTMTERKAIPPTHCDYLIRMHLKSIEAITKYMADGCGTGALNGPQNVCVELIRMRNMINKSLEEYSR